MEWDTEASVSIVCETQYKQLWPGRSSLEIKLQTYSKEHLVVVGSQDVQVCYENKKVTWLNWSKIYYLQSTRSAWEVLSSV